MKRQGRYKANFTKGGLMVPESRVRDPAMPHWTTATQEKLRTRVFGMMTEAGYLSDSRTRRLMPARVSPEVLRYLKESNQDYALRRMELAR